MTDDLKPEATEGEVVVGEVIEAEIDAAGFDLPEDPDEAVSVLVTELMEARSAAESRLEDLQRLAAEFDNFRKRALRDREGLAAYASQGLIEKLLPVLDTFDAAISGEASTETERRLLAGMESTRQQLLEVLSGEGVSVVATVGEAFDPTIHEAVAGGGTGHLIVTNELRRGYRLSDRVIRPALVQVAAEALEEDGA